MTTTSPIYTTEPMATRALAAEIRHDHIGLVQLLETRAGRASFGKLRDVRCETDKRLDIVLEFVGDDADARRVGIEAKFDHELTREQIDKELSNVEALFVLVSSRDAVPGWLATDYPGVPVITWAETLATFDESRLTIQDVSSIKLSKSRVEEILRRLDLEALLPGWWVNVERNGNGNPAILIYSPELPDGRTLRGQLQVIGRSTPDRLEDVRFESFFGVEVDLTDEHYFDPASSDAVPEWVQSLQRLHAHVLAGNEDRLVISRGAARASRKRVGAYKLALARTHLVGSTYLAQGYVDWALGPRTSKFTVEQLPELAAITKEVFAGWFAVESKALAGGMNRPGIAGGQC